MYQQLIDHLRNKRIVLLGMGREGHSTYNFIRRYLPEQKLIIADAKQVELDNDPNVEFVCGRQLSRRDRPRGYCHKDPRYSTPSFQEDRRVLR